MEIITGTKSMINSARRQWFIIGYAVWLYSVYQDGIALTAAVYCLSVLLTTSFAKRGTTDRVYAYEEQAHYNQISLYVSLTGIVTLFAYIIAEQISSTPYLHLEAITDIALNLLQYVIPSVVSITGMYSLIFNKPMTQLYPRVAE